MPNFPSHLDLKFHVIDNIQDEKSHDKMTEFFVYKSKTLKMIEYPEANKE